VYQLSLQNSTRKKGDDACPEKHSVTMSFCHCIVCHYTDMPLCGGATVSDGVTLRGSDVTPHRGSDITTRAVTSPQGQ